MENPSPTAHLADRIDGDDPAFSEIMEQIGTFMASGIKLTEETVDMAIAIGRRQHQTRTPEAPAKRRPGSHAPVVYYIRRGAMVKIGTTMNLRARMAAHLPEEILAIEPGGYELEAQRHRQFRDLLVAGQREWFHAGPALQRHVMSVRSLHGAPDPTLPVLSGG